MKLVTKALGITLGAAALCAIGAGAAGADTPPAYSSNRVLVTDITLHGWQSATLNGWHCDAEHPWLVNYDYSPGRIVPLGVEVVEPGGVGVTEEGDFTTGASNGISGWQNGGDSATNWDVVDRHLQIWAHCTNDPNQAYQNPGGNNQ